MFPRVGFSTSFPIKAVMNETRIFCIGVKERNSKATVTTCTICGQQIPVNELDEHMRIELLDPRWKSQRDALEARKAQASELQRGMSWYLFSVGFFLNDYPGLFFLGADVGSALKQLARARGDLFDGDDEKRRQQEEEERLRRKEREKAVWDGHTASKESTLNKYQAHVNFDEQIAAIHKAHGLGQYVHSILYLFRTDILLS